MDRLTIPDEPIEGGMRRAVIDARVVKESAMTIYWRLKAYEDTGMEPEQIYEMCAEERGIPKKPVVNTYYFFCPNCGSRRSIKQKHNFCHDCGQALEW
jgi:hypothetical protein|nr:MAG TPA: DNA-directed RNA polymerase [Caudoviricetes sp.]